MGFENPFAATDHERESQPPSSEKPASTKRLRELAITKEQNGSEEIDRQIEEQLLGLMQPGYRIGFGQTADVYQGREDDDLSGFCIKHRARSTENTPFDNSWEQEMKLQSEAQKILQEAAEQGIPVARVPRPIAYIKTSTGEEIMSMDYVPGKTLQRIMLERASQHMPAQHLLPGIQRHEITEASDEDLEEMVVNRYLRARDKDAAQLHRALLAKAGDPPFMPTETAIKLRNTIRVLNGKKFFHRDLHSKNVMFSPDLSQVYVIDFGRSSYKEYDNVNDASEHEKMGTHMRYLRDDGILTTLAALVKKPVKKT